MSEDLAPRLAVYLESHLDDVRDVEVTALARIHGGASRETYRCRARWRHAGVDVERGLILRRDPQSSLIETERDIEFAAYTTFQSSAVPVPAALLLETDPRWLDRPFFVMEEVAGSAANPFTPDPYGAHAPAIGEQFWRVLGRIAARRPEDSALRGKLPLPSPDECWRRELERWERVIEQDELEPQPIVRGAIRWLRRNPPPPPPRIAIVHGDYRLGNFLTDGESRIRAILDWELCHFGDPLEDVGWACDPLWGGMQSDRPAQLIDKARGLELWSAESGHAIDPLALRWWEIFAHVKGLAIWISSAKEYDSGNSRDPVMLISSWLCTERHNRILSERLLKLLDEARR